MFCCSGYGEESSLQETWVQRRGGVSACSKTTQGCPVRTNWSTQIVLSSNSKDKSMLCSRLFLLRSSKLLLCPTGKLRGSIYFSFRAICSLFLGWPSLRVCNQSMSVEGSILYHFIHLFYIIVTVIHGFQNVFPLFYGSAGEDVDKNAHSEGNFKLVGIIWEDLSRLYLTYCSNGSVC